MFKKLNTKKEWLTINKAIEYLTLTFEENVSKSDIYQLALENQLTMSVRFSSPFFIKYCTQTSLSKANFTIFHADTLKHIFQKDEQAEKEYSSNFPVLQPKDLNESELNEIRATILTHQKSMADSIEIEYEVTSKSKMESDLKDDGSIYSLLDRTYPPGRVIISANGLYLPQEEAYVEFDDTEGDVSRGTDDIWDILASSASQVYLERLYQKAENNRVPDSVSLAHGFYIKNPATSQIAVLYDYAGTDLVPALGLPRDSDIVIKTCELTRLITGSDIPNSLSTKKEDSYLKIIALLAKAYADKAGPIYGTKAKPNKSKIYEEIIKLASEDRHHGIGKSSFSSHVTDGCRLLD